MRLRYKAGAVDGAMESSSHGRGWGHNDLLILSLPEADVSQQVVCHSSAPSCPPATNKRLPCRYELKTDCLLGDNTLFLLYLTDELFMLIWFNMHKQCDN